MGNIRVFVDRLSDREIGCQPLQSGYNTFVFDISEIIAIEDTFHANDYQGEGRNPDIITIQGHVPVLLAAPHSVKHPRHNNLKKADLLTGTIATQIAKHTGAHAIILGKTKDEDPNFDVNGPFKAKLASILAKSRIKCVINIHGLSRQHPWDIVLGSGQGASLGTESELLSLTTTQLKRNNLTNILDNTGHYAANNPHNLSNYSFTHCKTPSFQIEINRKFRDPINQPEKYRQLMISLSRTVYTIANHN